MGKFKFVLNESGMREVLKSSAMMNLTKSTASSYHGNPKTFIGFDRAKTIVYEGKSK